MRLSRILPVGLIAIAGLSAIGPASAASREQQEMQRDIAQLQDQVRALQSALDQKLASLETLAAQAVDAANKANTNVGILSNGVGQTVGKELSDRLAPIAGLNAKISNVASDAADVRNSVADLTVQMSKVQQQLSDINNAIKVIQAPPAAPPPGSDVPGAVAGPPPQDLFNGAMKDYSAGKADAAASEFTDFLRFYPQDPNAITAQFYLAQIHYSQGKYDTAVKDFDAVLEQYPDNKLTPDAYFMKGMALKGSGHRDAGAIEFRALIKKYPTSDRAVQAKEQLRAMGLSVATGPARGTKKK